MFMDYQLFCQNISCSCTHDPPDGSIVFEIFGHGMYLVGIADECLDLTCTISTGMCTCMLGLHKILLTLKLVAMVGHVQSFAPFLAGNNWMVQKNG